MIRDIFEFWSQVPPDAKQHPDDNEVLRRTDARRHFDLQCLPGPFLGPLHTAPVVLLFLSPGLTPQDRRDARSPLAQARTAAARDGNLPLPGPDEHEAAWRWWRSKVSCVTRNWEALREHVAILNITPYHSKTFNERDFVASLPSARASIDWAQNVLFPEAEAGRRVVVVLRAQAAWGVRQGRRYGEALFLLNITHGGHMVDNPLRRRTIGAIRTAIPGLPL